MFASMIVVQTVLNLSHDIFVLMSSLNLEPNCLVDVEMELHYRSARLAKISSFKLLLDIKDCAIGVWTQLVVLYHHKWVWLKVMTSFFAMVSHP